MDWRRAGDGDQGMRQEDADVRSKLSQRRRAWLRSLGRPNGDGARAFDDANVALCEKERTRIEAACRRAFANRPSTRVKLEPSDFSQ
jgi:hypothetical protein